MRGFIWALALAMLLAPWAGPAGAHEERLALGRVEVIEPARKLLVVAEARSGARLRLRINPETDVLACGTATGLAAVAAGAMVRVKYLDREGEAPEAQSVLLLPASRKQRGASGR